MTTTQQLRHRRQHGCRRQHDSSQKPGAALGPILFSYQGPSQKRLHEMLQKRQRRKQLRQQSKVQRSLTLWSERATDYVDDLLKNRKTIHKSTTTTSSYSQTISKLNSAADLKLPTPFRAQTDAEKPHAPSTPAVSRRVELFSVDGKNNETRKMRSSRLDVGKLLTDIRKVADVEPQLQPRRMLEPIPVKDSKSKDSTNSDGTKGSFEELKTAILNDLDNGYESLQFVLQVAPKFMSSMVNSALQQVACDYLWSKTIIEKIFRIWPLAAGTNNDKRLFRDVLIQLYKYITRSLITWLTQYSPSIPEESPFLQELSKVIELLLKSVQCIAHHGSLSKTNKRLSFRGLFSSRAITTERPELSADSLKIKKRFSAKTQKSLESAFVDQMKCLRRDIGQRKNSIKCARWLTLAVPQEVQQEPMLLRSDSIASIAPLTSTFEPRKRRT